jgi:dihydrofolate reductase
VFNNATKHVASRTLDRVDWQNSILIKGDVADYVRGLKASNGPEIQVHGSGDLVQTLLKQDLVTRSRTSLTPEGAPHAAATPTSRPAHDRTVPVSVTTPFSLDTPSSSASSPAWR